MTDLSYRNIAGSSDLAIVNKIGEFVKYHRTNQNLTQSELAKNAGISRSTLSLLERGESVNVLTLLQVLRTLNQLHVFEAFFEEPQISPMQLAKENQKVRYRVRKSTAKNISKPESTW
ncbi:MAG: helix-turn-helix transcriptional regulator [Salibacteraceae bacterium]